MLQQWMMTPSTSLQWGGLWGSSKSLLVAALSRELESPLLVVCHDATSAACFYDDLLSWGCGATMFPARESSLGAEAEVLRERHHTLKLAKRDGYNGVLIAPLAALIQAVPALNDQDGFIELTTGMTLDADEFAKLLVAADFERVPAISAAGEFSRRGDILDFYAPAVGEPLRLEFFDDELESIRVFDLATQRTRHVLKFIEVPLNQTLEEAANGGDSLPLDVLGDTMRVVVIEPSAVDDQFSRLRFLGANAVNSLSRLSQQLDQRAVLGCATLPGTDGSLSTLSVEEYCQGVAEGSALLAVRATEGENARIVCSTPAESDRLQQVLDDNSQAKHKIVLQAGCLTQGFRIPEARLTVLHHRELIPGHGVHRPRPRNKSHRSEAVNTASSLNAGDLVVHAVHGLSRFRGIDRSDNVNQHQDFLLLEFDEGAELKVPVSRIDLVERYIGAGGGNPTLDRMGSGAFAKRRDKVLGAVEDLAAQMLSTQAIRHSSPGFAFDEVGTEQREFEASFPWTDTPDQAHCIQEIHDDLSQARPMDRLLCGDVGFGKTELAARAAFRAIMSRKQVALLVPTTVLAEQHYQTMLQRFADWPVRIELLSRLVKPARQREIIKDLQNGNVDFVIGTHRILSKTVNFSDLGLVIIDEEQRFGVRHKELLKEKREQVDVLTLTATPVPRTLHMAMAGIRDISSLSTAPIGRQEVHTEIRHDDDTLLITDAIQHELARGGQVFFLHNRVKTLDIVAEKIQRMVPSAKVIVGHGQMGADELSQTMKTFIEGRADILCATTIIESGLDIPNANTIFVDQAQRHGLADMHQLRGRVGRSNRRGYCYLLVPKGKPLPLDARRRLKAIEEMRYLGAGFQLSIRDLEIRGAGNLLGAEQSGHINAVGYETYRRLLRDAVARMKKDKKHLRKMRHQNPCGINIGIDASISPEYIAYESTRIEMLRQLDGIRDVHGVEDFMQTARDRFGPPPTDLLALANLFYLKHSLGKAGLYSIQFVDNYLACTIRDARRFERSFAECNIEFRMMAVNKARWMLPSKEMSSAQVLELLLRTSMILR
jgi:transcription-repair coupling factor (superfamily II helicase)